MLKQGWFSDCWLQERGQRSVVSEALLSERLRIGDAMLGYGTCYGGWIVFTWVGARLGGMTWVGRRLGWV